MSFFFVCNLLIMCVVLFCFFKILNCFIRIFIFDLGFVLGGKKHVGELKQTDSNIYWGGSVVYTKVIIISNLNDSEGN